MRFRTHVTNVSLLHKIVRYLSVMAKTCVIKLTPETVHFIVSGSEGGPEGVQIWSQVKVTTLFESFRIESRTNNEIYLEVTLEGMLKALRSAEVAGAGSGTTTAGNAVLNDGEVCLKLTKRNERAMLTFEIKGTSNNNNAMEIVHDVGVVVLSPTKVQELREPLCPTPDIHITLPQLQQLKGFAARLSHLGSTVTISANKLGTMTFKLNTDEMELETTWKKLQIPRFNRAPNPEEEDQAQEHPPDHFFSVTIGVKSLLKFLTTNLTNATTIACICDEYCLIAYVYIGAVDEAGGVMTFFLPALSAE